MELKKRLAAIEKHVRDRIGSFSKQRRNSLVAIQNRHPLNAEQDEQRKRRRVEAAAQVSPSTARAICDYENPKSLGLQGDQLLAAESIQGDTRDFVGVAFLERALLRARAVTRISRIAGASVGSGFLISNRLLITNNHVIPAAQVSSALVAEFEFEVGIDGNPKTISRFEFDPDTCFVTDPTDDLDYTVIALGARRSGQRSLAELGFCPLLDSPDKHSLGEFVNIVQHPSGDFKQVVLRENRLVSRGEHVLHYVADTLRGSSGSPVFNDQWNVVALHHFGEPHRETIGPNGEPIEMAVNEGIRISSIVTELREKISTLDEAARQLLTVALDSAHGPESTALSPSVGAAEPPMQSRNPTVDAQGRVTWTLPVEISVGFMLPSIRRDTPTVRLAAQPNTNVLTDDQRAAVDDDVLAEQFVASESSRIYHVSPKCSVAQRIKSSARISGPRASLGRRPHKGCPSD